MRVLDEIADDLVRHAGVASEWAVGLAEEIRAHACAERAVPRLDRVEGYDVFRLDHVDVSPDATKTREYQRQVARWPAGTKVFLYNNDETGMQQVSVVLIETPDYWIWSYEDEDAAREACADHGWAIDEVRSAL